MFIDDARETVLTRVLLLTLAATPLLAQDVWSRADSATVRAAPSRFPALPAAVRADLERRGCRIPQSAETGAPEPLHNVISGAFTGKGGADWAVLCSVHDTSQILVYRAAAAAAFDSLARAADRNFLQTIDGAGRIAYSRKLMGASAAYIRSHANAYNGPTPPSPLDHEGIDDGFQGKGSEIYYYFGGKWLKLQGAD